MSSWCSMCARHSERLQPCCSKYVSNDGVPVCERRSKSQLGVAQVSLIVGLLVGTVGMGAFVGVQIAQEGRSAVRMVTEALPTWSAEAYDSANASLSTALVKQVV